MSIPSTPTTDSPPPVAVPNSEVFRGYRPTYTPTNAELWRPVFDAILSTRQSRRVTTQDTGLKFTTLALNANDALKFLSENGLTEERMKYLQLRSQIKIRKEQGVGIYIHYKPTALLQIAGGVTSHHAVEVNWRDALTTWLETAQDGQVWSTLEAFGPLVVNEEDKKWVVGLLAPLDGVEVDIQTTYVRVMR